MDSIRSGGTSVVSDAAGNPHVTWIRDTSGTGAGGNNWDAVYRTRLNGVWGTTKVFSNPGGIDTEPHLVIKPDNSMTLFWCDSSIYITRFLNGGVAPNDRDAGERCRRGEHQRGLRPRARRHAHGRRGAEAGLHLQR